MVIGHEKLKERDSSSISMSTVEPLRHSENTTEIGTTAGSEGEIEILTWVGYVDTLSIEGASWSIVVACGVRISDDMTMGILIWMDEGLGDVTVVVVVISEI